MQKIAFLIVIGALAIAGIIYFIFDGSPSREPGGSKKVNIIQKWELPNSLDEISGITFLGENRIAGVQDEKGIIFIYNLKSSSIEKEIPFAGNGDYEGITIAGSTAYVLRSDGLIFEVKDFQKESKETIEHKLQFDENYDFEGIAYDSRNRRLLLSMKDKAGDDFKPILAYDLKTQQLEDEPAYKINFSDPVFSKLNRKKSHRMMRPSDLAFHPLSGDLYVLEGENPKLLIMDPSGELKELHVFKPNQFPQAEGITFGKGGEIYISNEGSGGPATILHVNLNTSK